MAMGSAVATYVGQNYGAGEIDRINKGVNQAMIVSVVLALLGLRQAKRKDWTDKDRDSPKS